MNCSEKNSATELTQRQHLAIAEILTSPSLEEARRRIQAAKGTFYGWLKEPVFQVELKRQREILVEQAFERLQGGLCQAVDKLRELLNVGQTSIQLRSAQTLLDHGLKVRALQDLEGRIAALEQRLSDSTGRR